MTTETDLYDDDFVGWTEEQARMLREAAAGRRTNLALDWEHLAEEIEDLGKSHGRALRSHIVRVIEHLLKLEFSPATEPRAGWMETVGRARLEIEDWLEDEPGLRPRLAGLIEQARPKAARLASKGLLGFREDAAGVRGRLQGGLYTDEQITGDWYPDRAT